MKVFILCAGEGTRMYPFTVYENKCLLKIGGLPVARIIADNISNSRIVKDTDINIICKPLHFKDFRHEFRDNSYRIMPIDSNVNGGTAGDFMNAFESYFKYRDVLTGLQEGDEIMIHYGDVITNVDYSMMMHYWLQNRDGLDLMLVGNNDIKHDYSKITTRIFDNVVSHFWEKPMIGYTSWTGIMIFPFYEDRGFYPFLRAQYRDHKELDFAYNLFPEFIKRETTMLYTNVEYGTKWYDAGNVRSYENLRKLFSETDKSPLRSSDY